MFQKMFRSFWFTWIIMFLQVLSSCVSIPLSLARSSIFEKGHAVSFSFFSLPSSLSLHSVFKASIERLVFASFLDEKRGDQKEKKLKKKGENNDGKEKRRVRRSMSRMSQRFWCIMFPLSLEGKKERSFLLFPPRKLSLFFFRFRLGN